jgi:hypothetical protein
MIYGSRGKCLSIAGNLPGSKTSKRSGAKTFGNPAFHQGRKFTYTVTRLPNDTENTKKQDGIDLNQSKGAGNAL